MFIVSTECHVTIWPHLSQDLEHKLRVYKYDSQFTEAVKSKVLCFDELKRHNCQLTEENKTLKSVGMPTHTHRYTNMHTYTHTGRKVTMWIFFATSCKASRRGVGVTRAKRPD